MLYARRVLICTGLALVLVRTLGAQNPAAVADSLLRAAEAIRAQGQRFSADSALPRVRLALAIAPTARAHALMADNFAQILNLRRTDRWAYDSTVLHSDAALAIDPRSAHAIFARAFAEGSNGNAAARLAGYERALAADSSFDRVVGLLISALGDAGREREAIALGVRMQTLQPKNYLAQFRLGWQYGYLWEQSSALAVFAKLAADTSAGVFRSWATGEEAYMARARGDFPAAVRYMEEATRIVPNDLVSRLGLAMMLLTNGDAARARPLIESGLARDSNATGYGSFSGRLLLGWAARDLKDTSLARRMFADAERGFKALAAAGSNQNANLLKLYALQGRREESVALLATLMKQRPTTIYGGLDDHDGSLESLRGVPEFEQYMARRRDAGNAKRAELGLPKVP